jgi:hypothetical protein
MNPLEGIRWPAIALQSIFMALNISFLLHGSSNAWILASTTLLIFLFIIQAALGNHRFLYLFPVYDGEPITAPDTWILRGTIFISIFLFYVGALNSLMWALILLIILSLFIAIWKVFLESCNGNIIEKKKEKSSTH